MIFDSAGGCGAFLADISKNDYRIADCDGEACAFLRQKFDTNKVFRTNSLIEVHRDKYSISSAAFLIMIGNPPYNDITSEFRNGEKDPRKIADFYKVKIDNIDSVDKIEKTIKDRLNKLVGKGL